MYLSTMVLHHLCQSLDYKDVIMICDTCKQQGLKSKVRIKSQNAIDFSQMDCYYDENGDWHIHDSNDYTDVMICENNHSWQVRHKPVSCANLRCQWGKAPPPPVFIPPPPVPVPGV